MANDLINPAYEMKPHVKTLNNRVQGTSGLVNTECAGRIMHLEGEWKLCESTPPHPELALHLAVHLYPL